MPGFDGSGPMGAGPMTGGARGVCNPANAGFNLQFGRGYGRGMGLRRGFRGGAGQGMGVGPGYGRGFGFYPPVGGTFYQMTAEDEMSMLKTQADYIKTSLDAIHKRIKELGKKPTE
ncbi:MAG: DUF5320 domain-containing protein [Thermodesulfobacteriota bacterium]|nr:DUF5320 domain-containing protein [Thermodesulfobacteriota bacterium]